MKALFSKQFRYDWSYCFLPAVVVGFAGYILDAYASQPGYEGTWPRVAVALIAYGVGWGFGWARNLPEVRREVTDDQIARWRSGITGKLQKVGDAVFLVVLALGTAMFFVFIIVFIVRLF